MIFDAFNNVEYDSEPIVDLIRDYRVYIDRVKNRYQMVKHIVVGDPTTEYLSYQLYGDPNLFWLIIYLNDIYDPWHGWVKSQEAVYESAEQKYKNMGGMEQILYHTDQNFEKYYDLVEHPDNREVWYHKGDKRFKHIQYVGYLHPVSVYESEEQENDSKRTIRIIKPSDINSFIDDLRREIDKVRRSE